MIWNGLGELVLASRFSCFAAFNDAPINVILVIRHYPNLCSDTYFVTGVDKKRREIPLAPIYNALGAMKAASLPGFHPLWGGGEGDDTGRFAGKGKLTFLKVMEELDSDNDKVHALSQLVEAEQVKLSEATINVIELIVCQLYLPRTELKNVADASSWLFKKKQAQSEGYPH